MTASVPDAPLHLVVTASTAHSLRMEIHGELDFDTADTLVATAGAELDDHRDLHDLDLDCSGLSMCDSAGLAALLMIRRRTAATGVRLRLTGRRPQLDRLLRITGTLHHLTGESAGKAEDQDQEVPGRP
ncbi:STAS domain-containing protein [Actinomadura formosensis]|uniref:STAS domain-containing protein n=1 Tax=Actinomadura formosensis TaxID=60706 RepID=UPI0008329ECC|nr:STAS domain-containing protein [Actinomadura formosensis]